MNDRLIPYLHPERVIQNLKTLQSLTADAQGAQRLAFTTPWHQARQFLQDLRKDLPVEVHVDGAANLWITLNGETEQSLVIGSHLDSVPNGGWLDGALGVLSGLEVLRAINAAFQGRPPMTVRLVDWADEEGARFGRSLFGSSAVTGNLEFASLNGLKDAEGHALLEVLREQGVTAQSLLEARNEVRMAIAYLELHIEQGPVLEDLDQPLGVVLGTMGVNRFRIAFQGQAAHSGTTPMRLRRDAFLAAARFTQAIYAETAALDGVCTIGRVTTQPGAVNCVVETCEILIEQRCLDPQALLTMQGLVRELSQNVAQEGGCSVAVEPIWHIAPVPFDPGLIDMGAEVTTYLAGSSHRLPSGAIHDATSMAAAGIPTGMLFVRSIDGISHHSSENSSESDLWMSVQALALLAEKVIGQTPGAKASS